MLPIIHSPPTHLRRHRGDAFALGYTISFSHPTLNCDPLEGMPVGAGAAIPFEIRAGYQTVALAICH